MLTYIFLVPKLTSMLTINKLLNNIIFLWIYHFILGFILFRIMILYNYTCNNMLINKIIINI